MIRRLLLSLLAAALVASPVAAAKPGGGGGGPLAKIICLDPGHGGGDPGATNGGFSEKQLNLDVSLRLRDLLAANGYTVYLTRTSDATLSNNDRYSFCNSTNATTLVSVHHNGSANLSVDYSQGLYHQNNSKTLASTVTAAVASAAGNPNAGIARFPSGVLIKSNMPSMISEGYFLSNSNRLQQLQANYSGLVDQEAQGLLSGITSYYSP